MQRHVALTDEAVDFIMVMIGECMMKKDLSAIVVPLLQWFEDNKRMLPWRLDKEPYHVWISEIMLQQTRIEAVMKYYARFTEALPDVAHLSRVDDDVLLKLWEGLGYYSRARNLKKAAQTIMTEFGGRFPQRFEQLRKLSGIGDYTAGAIASICFNERVPAVDGNVLRVIARIRGSRDNVLLPEVKKSVTEELRHIIPEAAGAFNESLMELGETICLPNGTPDCAHCPLQKLCTAYCEHLTGELPVRVKKQQRRKEQKSVFIINAPNGKLALEKRAEKGLLSGMYQLPNHDGLLAEDAIHQLLKSWGLAVIEVTVSKRAKHIFTHIEWQMQGYQVQVGKENERFVWASPQELKSTYALPTAFQKLLS